MPEQFDPLLPARRNDGAESADIESAAAAADAPPQNAPTALVVQPRRRTRRAGRHSGGQRALLALNVVVILACFAGAAGLMLGKRVRESVTAVPQATVVDEYGVPVGSDGAFVADPSATFPTVDSEAQNFLLVGDDSHPCVSPDSQWASAADPARDGLGQRSDTIMVVRVDPASRRTAVLSFPRDLWVKIPGKGNSRINSAYRKGDYTLLAQTLYDNFQVRVDHYVQVDFCAFKTIVDAVGGVAVPFERPARDTHIALHIDQPGCHTFQGDEALAYVRSRYYEYYTDEGKWVGDNAYDLGRISRQQDFLRRMLQAAGKKGVFNGSVARGLLEILTKYVVVDKELSIDDMLGFLGILSDVQADGIPTYQIQATRQIIQKNDVLLANIDGQHMHEVLAIFRGQASLGGTPASNGPTSADPSTTSATGAPSATTAPSGTPSSNPNSTPSSATSPDPAVGADATTGTAGTVGTAVDPPPDTRGVVPPADVEC